MRPPSGRGGVAGFREGRSDRKGIGFRRRERRWEVVSPHMHERVFVAKGKEDALVTKNMIPGKAVSNDKRISVQSEDGSKAEYRLWDPFHCNLAAAILVGIDSIRIEPGDKVLYLGAGSGTTVSHVSDIVGPTGAVYAVEFQDINGRNLVSMAKKRTNGIPIIEDARHPDQYRIRVGVVDVIFSDIAHPDQAKCIDPTLSAELVWEKEVKKLRQEQCKPLEQVTLEPFAREDTCVVIGLYLG